MDRLPARAGGKGPEVLRQCGAVQGGGANIRTHVFDSSSLGVTVSQVVRCDERPTANLGRASSFRFSSLAIRHNERHPDGVSGVNDLCRRLRCWIIVPHVTRRLTRPPRPNQRPRAVSRRWQRWQWGASDKRRRCPVPVVSAAWAVAVAAVAAGAAAGAYTRPLFSLTQAVLVSESLCVQFVASYDPHIY